MNAETYSPSSLETESEMLPQDPPPIIRLMGWWLISLFVVALFAAIFVHLPETEHAAFVLVPRDGRRSDSVAAPGDGESRFGYGRANGHGRRGTIRFAVG